MDLTATVSDLLARFPYLGDVLRHYGIDIGSEDLDQSLPSLIWLKGLDIDRVLADVREVVTTEGAALAIGEA